MTPARRIALFGALSGAITGVAAVWLGYRHSPLEFFDPDTKKWDAGYVLLVFGSWFVLPCAAAIAIAAAGWGLYRLVFPRGGSPR